MIRPKRLHVANESDPAIQLNGFAQMRKKMLIMVLALFTAGALGLLVWPEKIWSLAAGPADLGPVDFETLRKPEKKNFYLVCTRTICPNYEPDMESPVYDVSAGTLKTMGISVWGAEPGVMIVDNEEDKATVRFVQRTPFLKFPDTISVRFVPVSERQSTIAIFSRSQIGYSDLGANENRVKYWLELLDQAKP